MPPAHLDKPEAIVKSCCGCQKPTESRLVCPTCAKLSLPTSYFCGQECFKTNWKQHARIHNPAPLQTIKSLTVGKESLAFYKEDDPRTWEGDLFLRIFKGVNLERQMGSTYRTDGNFPQPTPATGPIVVQPIRPWPYTAMATIPLHISRPDYIKSDAEGRCVGDGQSWDEERARYLPTKCYRDEGELQRLRAACSLGRKVLDFAHSLVKPGITTEEIDDQVRQLIIDNNAYPSPLGYYGFPKSCCTSVNEVVCHGIPDLRPLKSGDIVNIDISVFHQGMHADLNETFCVGQVDEETKKLVKASHDSLMEAIAICKPGVPYRQIGEAISRVAEGRGFSVVRKYTGHGCGVLFHTKPTIPHFKSNKTKGVMEVGHCFTVEPMINGGSHHCEEWPDRWTSLTTDGKKSAQFEHQILITETGAEVLTARLPESPALEFDT